MLLDIEKAATVENIITARSGVFCKPVNKGYDEKNILKRLMLKIFYQNLCLVIGLDNFNQFPK